MNIKMKDMNGNVLFPSLQLPDNIATKEYVQNELEKVVSGEGGPLTRIEQLESTVSTQTSSITDINQQVEELKIDNNSKLNYKAYGGSTPHFVSMGNVGGSGAVITITLHNIEQFVIIFGNGSLDTAYMSFIGGSNFIDYSFGKNNLTSSSKNGNKVTVSLPSWFRGVAFSYLPFTISGI